MLAIGEAVEITKAAFEPLECRITQGRYDESLSVRVCDENGDIVEDLGTLPSSQFGQRVALNLILLSARQRLINAGHSLAGWSEV